MPPTTIPSLRLACHLAIASCASACSIGAPLAAEPIREAEQRQLQIGENARSMVAALDAMLGEYERNNLGGDDAKTVAALRAQLDKLSAEEMRTVVDLLQQSRATQDRSAASQTVANAFSAQKRISVEMSRILAAHSRSAEAAELAKRIDDLADRQARNLRDGIQLARLSKWSGAANFESIRNAQLETQRGEQAAIAQEIQLTAGRLAKLAANDSDATTARDAAQVMAQLKNVSSDAAAASELLKTGQLQPALAKEISGRDELRKLARIVAPKERGAEALRKAEGELAKLIEEQSGMQASAAKHPIEKEFAKWLSEQVNAKTLGKEFDGQPMEKLLANKELESRFNQQMAQNGAVLGRLEDQQGELAVKSDFLSQNMADLPRAVDALKNANADMTAARTALKEMNAAEAAAQQAKAMEKMTAAREEIQSRIEEAELMESRGGDKAKNLEMLKRAVDNLAREEAAAAKGEKPSRIQQADAARRAEKMASKAAELAPMAAEAMNAAASNAKASEQALAASDLPKSREEARRAAENLAKGAEAIAKELAKTEAAKQLAENAAAASAELGKLIEEEQSIDLETAKSAALSEKERKESLAKLATRQGSLQEKTEAFKGSLSPLQIAATQALGDAMAEMGAARSELEAGNAAPARDAVQSAIEKMLAAKNAVASEVAQAKKQMGNELPATPEELAKAANQIQQALQEVAGAREALTKAAEQMGQKAAQNAAEAAMMAAEAAQQAADAAKIASKQAADAGNQIAAQQALKAMESAENAKKSATMAAQSATQAAMQPGEQAMATAQQAAGQAAAAAKSATMAGEAAQAAQKASPDAAKQAGLSAEAAMRAAQAAQQAGQMAANAAQTAQNGAQAAQQSMQKAAQLLANAAQQAGQAAAQGMQLTPEMMSAAQQAAQQLANSAGMAMAGQNAPAQQAAQQAAEQLSQAASMMSAQQAGISQQQAGKSQQPGQGQEPGPGMKGEGQQPGRGSSTGKKQMANNQQPSEGAEDYKGGTDPQAVERMARQAALKKANFIGLPAREREAIQQSITEKYPSEYGAMVEQYLLNLANEAAKK